MVQKTRLNPEYYVQRYIEGKITFEELEDALFPLMVCAIRQAGYPLNRETMQEARIALSQCAKRYQPERGKFSSLLYLATYRLIERAKDDALLHVVTRRDVYFDDLPEGFMDRYSHRHHDEQSDTMDRMLSLQTVVQFVKSLQVQEHYKEWLLLYIGIHPSGREQDQLTFAEIGQLYGVSGEAVRQAVRKIINTIRKEYKEPEQLLERVMNFGHQASAVACSGSHDADSQTDTRRSEQD